MSSQCLSVSVVQKGECMRILSVDHGEKRIGLALSDPTATIASPLQVIKHVSRLLDAAQVANLANENDAGLIVITAFISPYHEDRVMARRTIGASRFVELYLSTELDTCEKRDPKGLYVLARRGDIIGFTGIGAPYEVPESPDFKLDTGNLTVDESIDRLFDVVARRIGDSQSGQR